MRYALGTRNYMYLGEIMMSTATDMREKNTQSKKINGRGS